MAPGSSIYGMTKAAVARLVRGLAWDFAARGIAVINVAPGPTQTDMNPADSPHADWVRNANPQKRIADPTRSRASSPTFARPSRRTSTARASPSTVASRRDADGSRAGSPRT